MPTEPMSSQRLDTRMVEIGMVSSRSRASRLIRSGAVSVNGQIVKKGACPVGEQDEILCREQERFVGRGGEKLEAALETFGIEPEGWSCLDVGASTGGFTDCLLQRGAREVTAIDVGHGQMHPRLVADLRVKLIEGLNARHLRLGELGEGFDLIVIDVSFISLTLVLPGVLSQSGGAPCSLIALIKPQFELSSEALNRKGIVKNDSLRQQALNRVVSFFEQRRDWSVREYVESPVIGGDGNREYLLYAQKN